jgi:EmrB/QacA subfamily drug resistance transporter
VRYAGEPPGLETRMKTRPLAIASAGAFVAALSTSLVAVSAPVIARDLDAKPADVSWVLSAYLLAVSSLLALAGKAADVLGQKRVYLTGFVFFVAGSTMCAAALDLRALVGARVLQGVGAAMLMAVGPAIVTRSVPPHQRARGLGIQLAATYIGLTLGPSAGGLLAAKIGWHAVFIVIAGAGAAGLAVALALLPPDDEAAARPGIRSLDLPGAALFAAGLSALLIALKRTQEDGWTGRPVLLIGAFAVVALAIFGRHTALHASPLLPVALFRKPAFAFGVLGATVLYTVTFMLAYLLPFQLQHGAGLSPARAGVFMTAQPAMMAVVAPMSGAIADRWGPRIPSVVGMLAIAGGMAAVGSSAMLAPGMLLVASLALVGFGAGLYVAPNSALVMGAAPRERQSTAAAMAATARNVGMTLGIALAASLEQAIGFRGALLVAAALGAGGALLGVVRPVAAP